VDSGSIGDDKLLVFPSQFGTFSRVETIVPFDMTAAIRFSLADVTLDDPHFLGHLRADVAQHRG
jgi:hypothetical protein